MVGVWLVHSCVSRVIAYEVCGVIANTHTHWAYTSHNTHCLTSLASLRHGARFNPPNYLGSCTYQPIRHRTQTRISFVIVVKHIFSNALILAKCLSAWYLARRGSHTPQLPCETCVFNSHYFFPSGIRNDNVVNGKNMRWWCTKIHLSRIINAAIHCRPGGDMDHLERCDWRKDCDLVSVKFK